MLWVHLLQFNWLKTTIGPLGHQFLTLSTRCSIQLHRKVRKARAGKAYMYCPPSHLLNNWYFFQDNCFTMKESKVSRTMYILYNCFTSVTFFCRESHSFTVKQLTSVSQVMKELLDVKCLWRPNNVPLMPFHTFHSTRPPGSAPEQFTSFRD